MAERTNAYSVPEGTPKPTQALHVSTFVRTALMQAEEPTPIASAAAAFSEAAFYIREGIGDPDYHIRRAIKDAKRRNLKPEEVERARRLGGELFALLVGGESIQVVSPESLVIVQKAQKQEEERIAQKRDKEKVKKTRTAWERLQRDFQSLMGLSESELRIQSANSRIPFPRFPVYKGADAQTKAKYKNRTLTKEEYDAIDTLAIKPSPDISTEQIIRELHTTAESDQTRSRIGQERFNALYGFVERLLRGESVPRSEIVEQGLNPETVIRRALRQEFNHFYNIRGKLQAARRRNRLNKSTSIIRYN